MDVDLWRFDMKVLCLIIMLLVCFCIVYCKIYRREQFMKQVKTVTDISDLEQDKNYLVQDEKLFLDDMEYFYNDSRCKNRIEKKYIKATHSLFRQIEERCDEVGELVFPMLVKLNGDKVKLSVYEEIWSKQC